MSTVLKHRLRPVIASPEGARQSSEFISLHWIASPPAASRNDDNTIPLILWRNHGSIFVISLTSSTLIPCRKASPSQRIRSGPGVFIFLSASPGVAPLIGSRPFQPFSIERSALRSDSSNVRPIAITSPTDFICVVKTEFV